MIPSQPIPVPRAPIAARMLRSQEKEDDDEETAAKKRRRKRNERQKHDIVLDESYKVLMDLIRMKGGEEVPEVKGWWY